MVVDTDQTGVDFTSIPKLASSAPSEEAVAGNVESSKQTATVNLNNTAATIALRFMRTSQ